MRNSLPFNSEFLFSDLANLVLDVIGKVPAWILAEQAPHPSTQDSEMSVSDTIIPKDASTAKCYSK